MESGARQTRIVALDFGLSRIGVALSDELNLIAHPRPFEPARPPARALRRLAQIIQQEGVGRVLVGLPRNMDGSEGASARRARKFAEQLAELVSVPIEMVDERWSTVQAQARLREAGHKQKDSRALIDSASAAVVLQAYLDSTGDRE